MKGHTARVAAVLAAMALPARAATPQAWELSSYDDFLKGTLNGLSIARNGRLTLAPKPSEVFASSQGAIWAMARATEPLPELPPQPVAPDPVPVPSAPEPSTPVAAPTDLVPVDELPPVLSQEKSAQADDPMATLIRAHAKEPAVGR